jgi:phosphatidylglycerol:prolipoprotein diacylglycerol transferase
MLPELFHLGDFSMPTYGVLFAVGIMLGLWVSARNSDRLGIGAQKARNLGALVAFGGIVGAKVLAILNSWNYYAVHPRELFGLATLQAGGVFLGGLVGALLAGAWYLRRNGMPALLTADAFAPGIALGHAVGRIGCFAAGCCWGKATDSFWGVSFHNPLAHEWSGTPLGVPLVPTQVVESLIEFVNFFVLSWLFRRRKFPGQVICVYFLLYGLARYGVEYFRGDPGRGSVFGGIMSGTQLISILLMAVGTFLFLRGTLCFPQRLPAIALPPKR